MKQCKQCGRTGGCGCLYVTSDLCKKCDAQNRRVELETDIAMEFKAEITAKVVGKTEVKNDE